MYVCRGHGRSGAGSLPQAGDSGQRHSQEDPGVWHLLQLPEEGKNCQGNNYYYIYKHHFKSP